MKKLFALLLLVVVMSACEKEATYCWKCKYYDTAPKTIELCNMSEKSIRYYEQNFIIKENSVSRLNCTMMFKK
jgi:hypothetical protein